MSRQKISDVLEHVNQKYIDEAIEYKHKSRMSGRLIWYKWGAVAVCVIAIIAGIIKLLPLQNVQEDNTQGKYKYQVSGSEAVIEWPWEYKTIAEKYNTIKYNGKEYFVKNTNQVSLDVLGENIGVGEAEGIDSYTDKKYTKTFEVYQISGIDTQKLIAAGEDGEYYVYRISDDTLKPSTFGELMMIYGLGENMEFNYYSVCEGYNKEGYYNLKDDDFIWKILSECKSACLDDTVDSFDRNNRNYLGFTITSEALGVYKRVVYISEDGYFATNIFDYSYIYYIGEEAAGKLIEYAKNNSNAEQPLVYETTIAGKIEKISDDYLLISDGVLCYNMEDSTTYKISTDNIRIKRCIDIREIKKGDIVVVKYNGKISENNEVYGGYSIYKGILVEGNLSVPE